MQNKRTLQFWDDYHVSNSEQEWIVQPTIGLFQLIQSHLPPPTSEVPPNELCILEIGCGMSTMARDFWDYLRRQLEEEAKQRRVHFLATDVSHVCVQACYQRDQNIPNVIMESSDEVDGRNDSSDAQNDIPQLHSTTPSTSSESTSTLEYRVLNLLEPPDTNLRGRCKAILDKACLDTFLFRSRQRGESKQYPEVLNTALDNIWSMLSSDGVYMLISPRNKLKAVRDYNGFKKVDRCCFDSPKKGSVAGSFTEDSICYIYICQKNLDYEPGVSRAFKAGFRELPSDETPCPHRGLLFVDFRKAEPVEGRGAVFWTRRWKSHCIHCKAPHTSKWSSS